jgi:hypothetical protein
MLIVDTLAIVSLHQECPEVAGVAGTYEEGKDTPTAKEGVRSGMLAGYLHTFSGINCIIMSTGLTS